MCNNDNNKEVIVFYGIFLTMLVLHGQRRFYLRIVCIYEPVVWYEDNFLWYVRCALILIVDGWHWRTDGEGGLEV